MDFVTRSPYAPGRFCIDNHELTSGDLIEFADGERTVVGRVEHDHTHYIVMCSGGQRQVPLVEIVQARYIGRGG